MVDPLVLSSTGSNSESDSSSTIVAVPNSRVFLNEQPCSLSEQKSTRVFIKTSALAVLTQGAGTSCVRTCSRLVYECAKLVIDVSL